eukprot:TRINITY_DN13108_c0_g1_i4.p1 TRINITY_DN13108_c0_g1~~TRINITY_DN13108_c0_g1_i4.p1  ORF type:complete len:229 (-),score=12.23 TRINITY_DN13108_c0_g1_i4:71-757(-)
MMGGPVNEGQNNWGVRRGDRDLSSLSTKRAAAKSPPPSQTSTVPQNAQKQPPVANHPQPSEKTPIKRTLFEILRGLQVSASSANVLSTRFIHVVRQLSRSALERQINQQTRLKTGEPRGDLCTEFSISIDEPSASRNDEKRSRNLGRNEQRQPVRIVGNEESTDRILFGLHNHISADINKPDVVERYGQYVKPKKSQEAHRLRDSKNRIERFGVGQRERTRTIGVPRK